MASSEFANLSAELDACSRLLGMQIPASYQAAVALQLAALLAQAQLVLDWPLADELEPASLFRP